MIRVELLVTLVTCNIFVYTPIIIKQPMESFLGRPKLNKSVHFAESSSSMPSCILSNSTLPFPILVKEDFSQIESDHDDNSVNKVEQIRFQADLLSSAKTLITDTLQISILRNRGCYGFSQNNENNLHNANSSCISREYNTDDDDDDNDDGVNDNGAASDADISVDNPYFAKVIGKTNENISGETDVSGLVLSDVETLFLLHGLGCLDVYLPTVENLQFHSITTATKYQHLEPLSLTEVWFYLCTGSANVPYLQLQTAREQIEKYSENELNLLRRYAVYIYYRSKGWIVRPGLCVGGADYLLYAEGPNRRHAAFCVLVDRDSRTKDGDQLNCASVAAHVRVAHSVNKRVILCRISLPSINEFSHNPWEAVRKTTIKETLIDYWKPNVK
ncbi:tRNA-splicing endonuclease subunit Sen2 [Schistosoma japonicum]|nr:tRNA-splicing endonuclease subunit Sen2 [Schistosoma japonicum]